MKQIIIISYSVRCIQPCCGEFAYAMQRNVSSRLPANVETLPRRYQSVFIGRSKPPPLYHVLRPGKTIELQPYWHLPYVAAPWPQARVSQAFPPLTGCISCLHYLPHTVANGNNNTTRQNSTRYRFLYNTTTQYSVSVRILLFSTVL